MQNRSDDIIKARDYQINLVETALRQNTIIYLPTGTGKTFIAVMVLRQIAGPLEKPISQGGKLSIMLVSTHALVNQQSQYLQRLTPFDVLAYGGNKNISSKKKASWKYELDKYQILVMTPKTLVNILQASVLSLNNINLLIFDECHRAVNNHPMRQLMINFEQLKEPPRIVGLTATLVNKNCTPQKIVTEIETLETTLHSKIATIEMQRIIEFSTNPKEVLKTFVEEEPPTVIINAIGYLEDIISLLERFKLNTNNNTPVSVDTNHTSLLRIPSNLVTTTKGFKGITKLMKDTIIQIQMLGIFGGRIAVIVRMEQLELIKKSCHDPTVCTILDAVITTLRIVKKIFENEMGNYNDSNCLYKFSTEKVLTLLNILKEYQHECKELLCGIIFVKRRFTAKILYHILIFLRVSDSTFGYLRPNFILGNNMNSQNCPTLHFYTQKTYKNILNQFLHKEINLLVASNVLEEGVDVPTCTLVVNFDKPANYRAYIQSKGRARHKNSFYYLIVNMNEYEKFKTAYEMYQQVEEKLNAHLTGCRKNKCGLLFDEDVHEPCGEYKFPTRPIIKPSSQKIINSVSAVDILRQYCLSLPSDKYTSYTPSWYLEHTENQNDCLYKVIIQLPTICPILEPIEGPYMKTKKFAKGAAALKACELLYEIGELDNNFQPKRHDVVDEDKMFFFKHWPKQEGSDVGSSKKGKIYSKQIPYVCRGQIKPHKAVYLHLIDLTPTFSSKVADTSQLMLHRSYYSQRCYGILTSQALPRLCKFPVYLTDGEIIVNFKVNQRIVILTAAEIASIKIFHHFVFQEILELLKCYLVFNNDEDAEILLMVPVRKSSDDYQIDVDIIKSVELLQNQNLTSSNEKNSKLALENYLGTIITASYGIKNKKYLVTNICSNNGSPNTFASKQNFSNFGNSSCGKKSSLIVRALHRKVNHLKPCEENKTSKGNKNEKVDDYFLPEHCTIQNFPSDLWVQAELLPSILHRITSLLQAEELRRRIAVETGLGIVNLTERENWEPLVLDTSIINCKTDQLQKIKHEKIKKSEPGCSTQPSPLTAMQLTLDALNEMIHMQSPWLKKDTVDDKEHDLHISFMDFDFCDYSVSHVFISKKVEKNTPASRATENIAQGIVEIENDIVLLKQKNSNKGPQLTDIFRALTTAKCSEIVNLERLETLGDSFLKLSIALFIILKYPHYNEGKASVFKGHLISNKNLYYVGAAKQLGGYITNLVLSAEWKPPCFCVPKPYSDKIKQEKIAINLVYSRDEQINGILKPKSEMRENLIEQSDEITFESMFTSLDIQTISNKTIADSVEALIGIYFQSCGFKGGLKLLEWLSIIPASESIENLLKVQPTNPLLLQNVTSNNIDCHIPSWQKIEERLGYHFNNRAYLLQALTHSSYTFNRLTNNYQKLEFLGDAILDLLITCHIYETCETLNPGQLTDLRSALVNNNTFASFTVRCGFHKFILFSNEKLLQYIDEFVQFQESKNFVIDDEVMILFEENDLYLAEQIDVPKVLGDVFEALAAAVFFDCGMNFQVVWNVFYRIMHKEIELFSRNIPKNAIRLIHESVDVQPKYHTPVIIDTGATMVGLDFILNGEIKTVYGFGENKFFAKRAAAKIALRLLAK